MNRLTRSQITVAVVPREKFSYAQATLDRLLRVTTLPFRLIYVDGNSPARVARAIGDTLAGRAETRIIRREHFLGPMQSRNLAIDACETDSEYLVILDNDVLVRAGWLENLLECAEQEQAGAVVPLVLIGGPDTDIIHCLGGDTGIRVRLGETELFHHQHLENLRLYEAGPQLRRQPTRLLEDHCIFARTALWKSFAPLDDRVPLMTSVPDFSFRFQGSGEKLLAEPSARVVYLFGVEAPLAWSDVPSWYLAWSEKWGRRAMREMAAELGISRSRDENRTAMWWVNNHRRLPLFPFFERNRERFERSPLLGKVVEKLVERAEDSLAMLVAEAVRHTRAGRGCACPALFAPDPPLPRHRPPASRPQPQPRAGTPPPASLSRLADL